MRTNSASLSAPAAAADRDIVIEHAVDDVRVRALGVRRWPIYASAPDAFEHVFGDRETCYVIEGEAHVTPAGGETFVFRQGDLATFPRGTRVYWDMPVRFRKHYRFG